MSPKHFNLLEDVQKRIISSVYSDHLLSLGELREEYSVFMSNSENVYENAKNSPHLAVDYLHSIQNALCRRRMIESYRTMLINLIDALREANHKSITLVFKRALDILEDDFAVELSVAIDEIVDDEECSSDESENECQIPTDVVYIEEGQTEIKECVYINRDDISVIVIPSSVRNIHSKAFINFYGSYRVNISNPIYSSSDGILYNKDKSMLLRVPIKVGFDAYSTAAAVKTIGKYAFQGLIHLICIDISDNVERIEDFAFSENLDLEEVHISKNVEYMGHQLFIGCDNLQIIYCDIDDLSKLKIESDTFASLDLLKVRLIVPPSVVEKYRQHTVLGKFKKIEANTNMLENKPEPEVPSYISAYTHYGGGGSGWGTFHGYQNVSGHWRSGHWRNGYWVSGHYVRSHGRYR